MSSKRALFILGCFFGSEYLLLSAKAMEMSESSWGKFAPVSYQ